MALGQLQHLESVFLHSGWLLSQCEAFNQRNAEAIGKREKFKQTPNLYVLDAFVVTPMTRPGPCEAHEQDSQCTIAKFALNQRQKAEELGDNPRQVPSMRLWQATCGAVMVMDEQVKPFSSECELEELKTLVESEVQPDRHVGITAVLPSTKGVDVPKSAGEFTQVPGKTRGKLVPRMSHVFSIGVSCPKLKKQVRTVESAPSVAPTVVLRFSTEAKYHEDPRWRGIVDNAGGAAHKWIHANVPAATQRQIRDIWSWQLQSSKGGGKALITALMRVELSAAKTLLSLSGQGAWFIEPLRWDQPDIPTCQVRWEKRLPDESGHVYAARVLSMAGNLGLARGLKNLGVRVPPASDKKVATTKVKTWKVTGVPRDWSHESLVPELEAAGLSNLQLTSRKPHGRTTCLFFTAECAQGTDFVELVFGNITITAAAFSPMKRMHSETQQLKTVSSLSFSPAFGQTRGSAEVQPAQRSSFYAASPVKMKPKAAVGHSQDTASAEATEKQPPVAVEASQPSEVKDVEMTSPAKAATKRMGGSPEKAAKPPKKRAVVRDVPKGLARVPNSAQGNCLFESIAQGLNPDNPKHARAIRAAVIAHLKRRADRYQPWWDNLRPDEEICDSWEEYLRLVSKAGAYAGCLEIAAGAAHFDRTIFVFCPFLAEPEAYNQSSKKGYICLWFQDRHYEYLKGDLNPELRANGPMQGGRGGGKSMSSGQSVSGATRISALPPERAPQSRGSASQAPTRVSALPSLPHDRHAQKRSSAAAGLTSNRAPESAFGESLPSDIFSLSGDPASCSDDESKPAEAVASAKRQDWTCPICGFWTGFKKHWTTVKKDHIRSWHPDKASQLSLNPRLPKLIPYSKDKCNWKCPLCDLGTPNEVKNLDALRKRCTPEPPRRGF